MPRNITSIVLAASFAAFLSLGSGSLSAADYPLEQKLQQCEAAFKASRSKTATREQASKARAQHFELMVDILQHLNNENVATLDQGKTLTAKQLTNNVRVMGHLLEMLAADHLGAQLDWSYLY